MDRCFPFGMHKNNFSAENLRVFIFYIWVFNFWHIKLLSGALHNITEESFSQFCRNSSEEFICDPTEKLSPLSRLTLGSFLRTIPRDTPCFCRPPCSDNEYAAFPTKHLAIGVVIPISRLSDRAAVHTFAGNLRSKWSPGACPGNDVLLFVLGTKVYVDYGDLSRQFLTPRCMASLPTDYKLADITLSQVATVVKDHFLNPCPVDAVGENAVQSWLKIPTMLLACLCLLLWLVFIGRRAHLRRLSASATAQLASRYHRSLYDLPSPLDRHSFGAQAMMFQPARRPFYPSQRGLNARRVSDEPGYRFVPGQGQRLSSFTGSADDSEDPIDLLESHLHARRCRRTPSPPPAYCSLTKAPSEGCPHESVKPVEDSEQSGSGIVTPFGEPDPAQAPPAYADLIESVGGGGRASASPPLSSNSAK